MPDMTWRALVNLKYMHDNIPWLDEVSIGHALISDALYLGLKQTIEEYDFFTGRIVKMDMGHFILYTTLGSDLWTTILAFLGYQFGAQQELLKKYCISKYWHDSLSIANFRLYNIQKEIHTI